MGVADNVLFEPIQNKPAMLPAHQGLLDAIAHSLDGLQNFEFKVVPGVPIDLYERIVDLVENDPSQIAYLSGMVHPDPAGLMRPTSALTIKTVFHRIMAGNTNFWHCGKASSGGSRVGEFEFANVFGIHYRLPFLELKTGRRPSNCFEWWAASLLPGYSGYHSHYSFGSEDEARKYYHSP